MKPFTFLPILLTAFAAQLLEGCTKDHKADATRPLQQAFKEAEPSVKQSVVTVTASLRSGHYLEAARSLDPVLTRTNLTPQQRQALGVALQQLNQAVGANPALDTKEMYELRAKISKKLTSGPRF